ncbi:MAG TPA: TldD/PmbA family protein [Blastocatellia bacterium]|jgi:predicted Zn-dependent protease|nr:TldD/PmbA family protein [Blastocatellia bacterium]
MMTRDECAELFKRVVAMKDKSDGLSVSIQGGESAGSRFTNNTMSANLSRNDDNLTVTARVGKREGNASTNKLDHGSLKAAVEAAEFAASIAPPNPEQMPLVGPQKYPDINSWRESLAAATPADRARLLKACSDVCKKYDVNGYGFLSTTNTYVFSAATSGNEFYTRDTVASYSMTARTKDATGSGWANQVGLRDLKEFDMERVARTACEKAVRSRDPKMVEPGRWTVILEPAAAITFLGHIAQSLNARAADEGRSAMYNREKKVSRIGEQVLGENVTIRTEPLNPQILGSPSLGGLPARNVTWFEKGVLKNLSYDRYWAEQKKAEPTPPPIYLSMEGGSATVEDMIRSTERGLLVTHFWYVVFTDPQTVSYTGITRDGLFLIEKGKVTMPCVNMRFNDSAISIFNNITILGKPERQGGGFGNPQGINLVPPMKVENFNFRSISPSV